MDTHHTCPICPDIFDSEDDVVNHLFDCHTKTNPIKELSQERALEMNLWRPFEKLQGVRSRFISLPLLNKVVLLLAKFDQVFDAIGEESYMFGYKILVLRGPGGIEDLTVTFESDGKDKGLKAFFDNTCVDNHDENT